MPYKNNTAFCTAQPSTHSSKPGGTAPASQDLGAQPKQWVLGEDARHPKGATQPQNLKKIQPPPNKKPLPCRGGGGSTPSAPPLQPPWLLGWGEQKCRLPSCREEVPKSLGAGEPPDWWLPQRGLHPGSAPGGSNQAGYGGGGGPRPALCSLGFGLHFRAASSHPPQPRSPPIAPASRAPRPRYPPVVVGGSRLCLGSRVRRGDGGSGRRMAADCAAAAAAGAWRDGFSLPVSAPPPPRAAPPRSAPCRAPGEGGALGSCGEEGMGVPAALLKRGPGGGGGDAAGRAEQGAIKGSSCSKGGLGWMLRTTFWLGRWGSAGTVSPGRGGLSMHRGFEEPGRGTWLG